jgi:hypothetical protein
MTPGEKALMRMADVSAVLLPFEIAMLVLFCAVMLSALLLMAPALKAAIKELLDLD